MPTSRPVRLTVIQTSGLAQTRIFFPTENEPIFWHWRPSLKPERGGHFARIQTQANSQYAIKKTGVNNGSVTLTSRGSLPRFYSCVRPIRYKKIKKRSHFPIPAAKPECEAPLAKMQTKANLQCSRRAAGVRAQPRRPLSLSTRFAMRERAAIRVADASGKMPGSG